MLRSQRALTGTPGQSLPCTGPALALLLLTAACFPAQAGPSTSSSSATHSSSSAGGNVSHNSAAQQTSPRSSSRYSSQNYGTAINSPWQSSPDYSRSSQDRYFNSGNSNLIVPIITPSYGAAPEEGPEYGAVRDQIRHIEDLLRNTRQTLCETDHTSFQSRLSGIKQCLFNGATPRAMVQPLQSQEGSINEQLAETARQHESKKSQLDDWFTRLDRLLDIHSRELSSEDAGTFSDKLKDLRSQSRQDTAFSDETIDRLTRSAHDLAFQIEDKFLFPAQKGSLTFTRNEPANKKEAEDSPFAGSGIDTQSQSENTAKNTHLPIIPTLPPLPIPKLIGIIENELMDFHEKRQIGSFDIDSFTQRLLAQKRNFQVMLSKTGTISSWQESLLRQELEQIREDLTNQVTGKN